MKRAEWPLFELIPLWPRDACAQFDWRQPASTSLHQAPTTSGGVLDMMSIMRKSDSHDGCHASSTMSDPVLTRAELKRASRTRILDAGGARLRMEGLEGAVIAQVMQDAGLTHGAFYSHFADKDELTVAAFRHAITESRQRWVGTTPDRSWGARVARLARGYLSRTHRDDRDAGPDRRSSGLNRGLGQDRRDRTDPAV